jgi:hypothetical protein
MFKRKVIEKKNKSGRPKKNIDPKLVFELAKIHCTKEEMASILGCNKDTLYARFSDIMQNGWDEGKASLKRLQWKSAETGNTTMLVWLGKQWLGQKDKAPEEVPNTIINVSVNPIP